MESNWELSRTDERALFRKVHSSAAYLIIDFLIFVLMRQQRTTGCSFINDHFIFLRIVSCLLYTVILTKGNAPSLETENRLKEEKMLKLSLFLLRLVIRILLCRGVEKHRTYDLYFSINETK